MFFQTMKDFDAEILAHKVTLEQEFLLKIRSLSSLVDFFSTLHLFDVILGEIVNQPQCKQQLSRTTFKFLTICDARLTILFNLFFYLFFYMLD